MGELPEPDEDARGDLLRPSSVAPTMLKALLREHHLQNYGMFKRAYQKAARGLDKELVDTYPSRGTLHRWLAGLVKELPYPHHCAVLEAMLPGWTAADLFKPYTAPEEAEGSTLLRELLRRRFLHTYRAFCDAYNVAAGAIDKSLVGTYPAEQQFYRWMSGDMDGLPYPTHCNVLEAMFPPYTARQLFEVAESAEPASADDPDPDNATKNLVAETPRDASLMVPDEASASAWAAVVGLQLPDEVITPLVKHLETLASSLVTPDERDRAYHRLVQILRRWAHTVDRRNLLRALGRAATAASLFHFLDPDEHERVASVLATPGRVDAQTIEHIDTILRSCKRQDDALGPQAVLDTVLAQRDLVRSLLPDCPDCLRPRLLSALSYASNQAGWLSFDLNEFDSAAYYYDDARSLAHEAENPELAAYVLRRMSQLASWQDQPHIGIDRAVAAGQWASRTGDMRLRAYCADGTAQAYAAARQRDACMAELDVAATTLTKIGHQAPGYIYIYDEALHVGMRSLCHLKLGDAEPAAAYAQQALANLDPSFTRVAAMGTVDLGRAYTLSGEVDEAAHLLGSAGEMAAQNSSARLIKAVRQARAELQPWKTSPAVRELDDRLATYGLA